MLIPKISYIGAVSSTLVTPGIHLITLKNSTLTTADMDTVVWSVITLSGTPNILFSESADDEFVIGLTTLSAYKVRINLSVVDSLGRSAQTSALFINDGGGNFNLITLNLNANILAGGLGVFTPEETQTTITGNPIIVTDPLFDTYSIDYTNNLVYDDSNTTGESFQNIYTTTDDTNVQLSVISATAGIAIGELFAQATFNPVIISPINVLVETATDCTTISAYSQSSDMIEKLIRRAGIDNSSMSYLEIVVDENCCDHDATIQLAPRYAFSVTPVDITYLATPNTLTVGGNLYSIYTVSLTLGGIDQSLISSITYTTGANSDTTTTTLTTIPNDLVIPGFQFLIENPVGSIFPEIVETKTMTIVTTTGYTYEFTFTMTPTHITQLVRTAVTNTVYPDYPTGVSIIENVSNTSIQLSPISIEQDEVSFRDGIYSIELNDSGISNSYIKGCAFMDCKTECFIINAIANGCSPYIKIIYDTLVNFNTCDAVSCSNVCELYAYLESLLNECDCSIYSTNSLSVSSDCGCN